jgi:sugar lactone lactonase YvrE
LRTLGESAGRSTRARRPALLGLAVVVLLALVGAVPVLADSPPPPTPPPVTQPPSNVGGDEEVQLPGSDDMAATLAGFQQESEEGAAALASPGMVADRIASRSKFGGLDAGASRRLFESVFANRLSDLEAEPARRLEDAHVLRAIGPDAAVVSVDGKKQLVEGSVPLLTGGEGGQPSKADLGLVGGADGFEPADPLVDLRIPRSAGGMVEVGDAGLALGQEVERGATPGVSDGLDVFYADVATDTDLVAAPISSGVELFDQLRSPRSPEDVTFSVDLPAGAKLEPGEGGGAEIVSGGKSVASVPAPVAEDAQGSEVPVSLAVDGTSLVVHVAHTGGDFAYPILVDPIVEDWVNASWFGGNPQSLQALTNGAWQWNSNASWIYGSTSCIYTCWSGSGRGLYISTPSGYLPPNGFGQFSYSAPNSHSYLANAWITPFYRDNHTNCLPSQYAEPYDYDGMWNENSWNKIEYNQSNQHGAANIETWGRAFIIGMGTASGISIPCWRDDMAGGVAIWLEDWERPELSTTSTAQWMDTAAPRLNVSATDIGLGVKKFEASAVDASGNTQVWWTEDPCSGLYGSRCPNTWNLADGGQPALSFNPAVLPEGIDQLNVQAFDVTEKPSTSTRTMTVRVDHAAPSIALTGTLTEQATLGTDRPSYTLKAEARDGVPGSEAPADVRSGAATLVFENDGQVVSEMSPGCATQSCSLYREIEVPAASLTPGEHTLTVKATDAMGHVGVKSLKYTTATDRTAPEIRRSGLPAELETTPTHADFWASYGSVGSADGHFSHPGGLALDHAGDVWVADSENNRIEELGSNGEFLGKFGSLGAAPGQLNHPHGISLAPDGSFWVADWGNNRAERFNVKGELLAVAGSAGKGDGQLREPWDVAVDAAGNVLVADNNGRIEEFNSSGVFVKTIGEKGTGPGKLSKPTGIDVEADGEIFVADGGNADVSVFSASGEFERQFGVKGSGPGQFQIPAGLAVGARGEVWVSDHVTNYIQEFDRNGNYLGKVGTSGKGPGQLGIAFESSMATDSKGNLWIADTNNYRIQHWLVPVGAIGAHPEPILAEAVDSGTGVAKLQLTIAAAGEAAKVLGQKTQTCGKGGCSLESTFEELDLTDYKPGSYLLSVTATDVAGNSSTVSRPLTVDPTGPAIALSGTLSERDGEPLNAVDGNVHVSATDADGASPGVSEVRILRDSGLVASSHCQSSCRSFESEYAYKGATDGAARALSPVSTAEEGTIGVLNRVSCAAANDCWAVGVSTRSPAEVSAGKKAGALLEHWDGAIWKAVPAPKPTGATSLTLEGISCAGPSSCVAVGSSITPSLTAPFVEIWNGTAWRTEVLPAPTAGSSPRGVLTDVSCTAAADCWAVGTIKPSSTELTAGKLPGSFAEHWNGTAWKGQLVVQSLPLATLSSIDCVSSTHCVAVGGTTTTIAAQPWVATLNGATWSPVVISTEPTVVGPLVSVSCVSTTDCWAAGRHSPTVAETGGANEVSFLLRLTGTTWSVKHAPTAIGSTHVDLRGVSCSSSTSCLLVGRYAGEESGTPFAATWDGTEWKSQPVPAWPESTAETIRGVDCIAADQCSLVGNTRGAGESWGALGGVEEPSHGEHDLTIEAVDFQGNTSSRQITVDAAPPAPPLECEAAPTSVAPHAVVSPAGAIESLEHSLPQAIAPSVGTTQELTEAKIDPTFGAPDPKLSAEGTLAESETAVEAAEGFSLGDVACVQPAELTAAATEAQVVNGDAAVFANTGPETDTVVRPSSAGVTTVEALRGPSAPHRYSWTVEVAEGEELVSLPSGGVAVVEASAGEGSEGGTELAAPAGLETPRVLNDASLQQEEAVYDLASAQAEVPQEVLAVIPVPWVVLAEGQVVPTRIEVEPDVDTPTVYEVEVILPEFDVNESQNPTDPKHAHNYPAHLDVAATASVATDGKCPRFASPCGTPEYLRMTHYAEYWGNETHDRNPEFSDFGDNNCTNFVSQVIQAGGMKYMHAFAEADDAWWFRRGYNGLGNFEFRSAGNWRLADKLPRHLWQFGLAELEPVQNPSHWGTGDIIAEDWYGTEGKGNFNHLQFAVGAVQFTGQAQEPLIANSSSAGSNYSHKPWNEVVKRIQEAEGGEGWNRVALMVKHTAANLYEKKHDPDNLYDENGIFHG